jgi:hypothetical protein
MDSTIAFAVNMTLFKVYFLDWRKIECKKRIIYYCITEKMVVILQKKADAEDI